MNEAGQTICLCMIVKNERHVITRCLHSVLPLLDAWAIVDTGSTDGTQERVRELLGHLPGELVERPWVSFAHNRTESLRYARDRADYTLIIDADEMLELPPDFKLPTLTADAYDFEMLSAQLTYYKTQLVTNALEWRYQGVVHEYIYAASPTEPTRERAARCAGDKDSGWRAIKRSADLSQGCLSAGRGAAARTKQRAPHVLPRSELRRCAGAGAVDRPLQEASRNGVAGPRKSGLRCTRSRAWKETKGDDWPQTLTAYLAAFAYRPDRAEPLYRIGIYYQTQQQYPLAYLFLSQAMQIPYPVSDLLFVEKEVYDYLLPLEFSVACFYVGRHQEAIAASDALLATTTLTPDQVRQVTQNRQFSIDALKQT